MSKYSPIALLFLLLPTIAVATNNSDIVNTNSRMLLSSLSLMETCGNAIGEPYTKRRNSLESKLRELIDVAGFDAETFWKTYRKKIDAYQLVDGAGLRAGMTADELTEFRSNCEMFHRTAVHDETSVAEATRALRRSTSLSRERSRT
jgi:hypothetical protein